MNELFDISEETAIVTGAASGIGRRFCQILVEAGAKVAAADLNYQGVKETCNRVNDKSRITAVKVNVVDKESVNKMVENVVNIFGKPTILVNCAGISASSPLVDMSLEKWNSVLNVLLTGTFLCCQAVLPHMREKKKGKIVNIGSIAAFTSPKGHPGTHNYSAGKAGVLAFTRTLAVECARDKINVNAISPGFVKTPMTQKAVENEKRREEMVSNLPLGRLAEVTDLDGTLIFLVSPASDYITGQNIIIDGGYLLW